jgi:hypothetical protein
VQDFEINKGKYWAKLEAAVFEIAHIENVIAEIGQFIEIGREAKTIDFDFWELVGRRVLSFADLTAVEHDVPPSVLDELLEELDLDASLNGRRRGFARRFQAIGCGKLVPRAVSSSRRSRSIRVVPSILNTKSAP